MTNIEIIADQWAQLVGENRIIRRKGDVVDASERDAERLIKCGAAKATRRKVTVTDQKDTSKNPEQDDEANKQLEELDKADSSPDIDMPAATAGADAWRTYALAQGKTEDELQGLNRHAIRALFVK